MAMSNLCVCADCRVEFQGVRAECNVCDDCFALQFPGITCQEEWDAYWGHDVEEPAPFVGPAEFDAVFGWELAPLSEEQPAHRENLGNCTGCDRTYVYVDSRWSMCTRCWDRIPAEYDAWVASLPRAIPLSDGPVAPASWPVWVLAATSAVLVIELIFLMTW
jgi:hypothetical protein